MNLPQDYNLSSLDVVKIIQNNQVNLSKIQMLQKYYDNQHNILKKYVQDSTKPNNKLLFNFPKYIADNYTSFIVGNPVTYNCMDTSLLDNLQYILDYNDTSALDAKLCSDMNVTGTAFELHYIDENGINRFTSIPPQEGIVIYDDTLEQNILYFIRVIINTDLDNNITYTIELYDKKSVKRYSADSLFGNLTFVDEQEHYYNDVPVIVYQDKSCFEDVLSLIDAFEKLSSAEVDDYEEFVNSYMILKGMTAEAEDIQQMKQNRVLLLDTDADASYLVKQADTTQIESIKQDLITNIHKLSCCPNFADESFGTSSGVAMRYKLLGFTNAAQGKIRSFKKGLMRRLELICNILNLKGNNFDFTMIKPVFTPNLPVDLQESVTLVNQLRGLVSDETLLSILPFVDDVGAELERVQKQNENDYQIGA